MWYHKLFIGCSRDCWKNKRGYCKWHSFIILISKNFVASYYDSNMCTINFPKFFWVSNQPKSEKRGLISDSIQQVAALMKDFGLETNPFPISKQILSNKFFFILNISVKHLRFDRFLKKQIIMQNSFKHTRVISVTFS